jgi:uncharacterized protein (DUF302 family)
MNYYFAKTLKNTSFEEAILNATEALKEEGFGVLTEIDVSATMKKKLNEDFRPYRILGACNPHYAFRALSAEDKIGAMLPCNVIVQQVDGGVEVAAVDPVASMSAVENNALEPLALEVREKLKAVINRL